MMELIQLKNITKAYRRQSPDAPALEDINLTIHRGELIAIMGPSGSGKSTLLNILGFMDHPTEGEYLLTLNLCNESRLVIFIGQEIKWLDLFFNILPCSKIIQFRIMLYCR